MRNRILINSLSVIKISRLCFTKAMLLLCFTLFLVVSNLSVKAQSYVERAQFYQDYQTAINDKTAIINADDVLHQEALKSGWFQQVASGLKNAENYSKGIILKSARIIGNVGSISLASSNNGTCSTATPFCTSSGSTYPAGVSTGSGESGPIYGCLGSTPNPAWFFLRIATGGDIHITETNSSVSDVDFILWGPFVSQYACSSLTADKIADCSYTVSATEYIDIASAVADQYYDITDN